MPREHRPADSENPERFPFSENPLNPFNPL